MVVMSEVRTGHVPGTGYERVLHFAEEVGVQAIGTVTGAGLLYVFAGWFGMVQAPPARIVLAVVVATLIPALCVVLLRRRPARPPEQDGGLDDAE